MVWSANTGSRLRGNDDVGYSLADCSDSQFESCPRRPGALWRASETHSIFVTDGPADSDLSGQSRLTTAVEQLPNMNAPMDRHGDSHIAGDRSGRIGRRVSPGDSAPSSDGELVVPDAAALDDLLRRFWHPLVAYVARLLGETEAAEDVVQRAFVRLWERGHALPAGDEVRPFLYRMVRNLASNEWRRRQKQRSWLDEESLLHSTSVMPSQGPEEDELAAALTAAVERLPARRREVFVLSRYHSLSNAQIAEVLSIAPQTVANQLVSALRELRVMLGPYLDERSFPSLRIVRGKDVAAG